MTTGIPDHTPGRLHAHPPAGHTRISSNGAADKYIQRAAGSWRFWATGTFATGSFTFPIIPGNPVPIWSTTGSQISVLSQMVEIMNGDAFEDMIEDWLKFVEFVATADYTDSPRPTLVLDQIQKAVEFAIHSETHKDVRKQVLELFAIALTNTTIPVDHRERLARQIIQDPEQYRNAWLTNKQAFEVLLEILRQSQEAVIEIAVAESIRDHLRLNFERRMSLELILEHIDSEQATVILEQFLNQ